MRVSLRRGPRPTRLSAAVVAAAALAAALTGNTASAATSDGSTSSAGRVVRPAALDPTQSLLWRSVNSGACLDYSPNDLGAAWQDLCSAPDHDDDDFTPPLWHFQNVGRGSYEIVNNQRNQCLSVKDASMSDGATVLILNCRNDPSQVFVLRADPADANSFEFKNVHSGKCVSVGGASHFLEAWVIQWTCANSPEFFWTPTPAA